MRRGSGSRRQAPGGLRGAKLRTVVAAGKAGPRIDAGWGLPLRINGRAPYVREARASFLRRLGGDVTDLRRAPPPPPRRG